jgi:hypothetical protein
MSYATHIKCVWHHCQGSISGAPYTRELQAIKPHLFAPSPELGSVGWPGEATLHLSNLVGGLRMPTYPQKSGCVNIMTSQVTCKYNDLASYKQASLSMDSQRHKPRDDQDTYAAKALITSPTWCLSLDVGQQKYSVTVYLNERDIRWFWDTYSTRVCKSPNLIQLSLCLQITQPYSTRVGKRYTYRLQNSRIFFWKLKINYNRFN